MPKAFTRTQIINLPRPKSSAEQRFGRRWTDQTYAWFALFERDFRRQSEGGDFGGANFILMASDFLFERYGEDADWNRLDLQGLVDFFPTFNRMPGFTMQMVSSVVAFCCYLGNTGRVTPETHRNVRQVGLDWLMREGVVPTVPTSDAAECKAGLRCRPKLM